MRKGIILRCVLTFMLLLGIYGGASLTTLAAEGVTVQVNDISVSPGQTVTTEVVMNGTFAAIQGRLLYDTDALTLEGMEATDAISGSMTIFNQDAITSEFLDASFAIASTSDMTVDGAVLTLTFRAGDNANGTYSFRVEQFQVYDAAGEELTVEPIDTIVDKEALEPMVTSGEGDTKEEDSGISSPKVSKAEPKKSETKSGATDSKSVPEPLTSTWNGSVPSDSNGGVMPFVVLAVLAVGVIALVVFFRVKKKRDV